MRKYYDDYEEDNFNKDYERGYEDGRRNYLREHLEQKGNVSFEDFRKRIDTASKNYEKYKKYIISTRAEFDVKAKLDSDKYNKIIKDTIIGDFIKKLKKVANVKTDGDIGTDFSIFIKSNDTTIELVWTNIGCDSSIHYLDEEDGSLLNPGIFSYGAFWAYVNDKEDKNIKNAFAKYYNYSATSSLNTMEKSFNSLFNAIKDYL